MHWCGRHMVTHGGESFSQRPRKLGGAKALPHSLALKSQGPRCLQGGFGCRVRATLESTTLIGYNYLPSLSGDLLLREGGDGTQPRPVCGKLSTRPEEDLGNRKFASPHQGLAH